MHFEAGALADKLSPPDKKDALSRSDEESTYPSETRSRHRRRLFTLLHGVTAAEIDGPLSAYQATSTTKEEMGQLVDLLKHIIAGKGDEPVSTKAIAPDIWNEFESALAIDPPLRRPAVAHLGAARAYLAMKDPVRARKAVAEALRLEPQNQQALALKKKIK